MNILFILKSYEMGGLEVVTTVLANKFVNEGHAVSIFAFEPAVKPSIADRLDKRIHIYTLKYPRYCIANVYAMRAVMAEEHTQLVINQWGLPFYPLKTAMKAAKGINIKFISVYHNTPDMNGRLQMVDNQIQIATNQFKRLLLMLKRKVFKEITSYGMRWNYYHSDNFMVLSPSFIDKFKDFTGIHHARKLIVQTNPVTIDCSGYEYHPEKKLKEIVYVGRLDFLQKKVNRVIDTWALLEKKFPEWRLTIVGDGSDRPNVELQVKRLNLKRVLFEGFQKPTAYYKRASMLMLTSEFEGFPLVLAEAMSFGVIPVVYNSYAAANDIVKDDINGLLIPYSKEGFKADIMASKMAIVMNSSDKLHSMAMKAIETSKEYAVDNIYKQWLCVMEGLSKEKK